MSKSLLKGFGEAPRGHPAFPKSLPWCAFARRSRANAHQTRICEGAASRAPDFDMVLLMRKGTLCLPSLA